MSKARVVVVEVTSGHLTVTAAARAYGLSRQHIYRLLQRYHLGGLDGALANDIAAASGTLFSFTLKVSVPVNQIN